MTEPPMTRKEALATLHSMFFRFVRYIPEEVFFSPEHEALRQQVYEAFHILTLAIHGKPTNQQLPSLCDRCFLLYAQQALTLQEGHSVRFFCSACAEHLQAQNHTIPVESPDIERVV